MKYAIVFISASRDWMESKFMFEWIVMKPPDGWQIAISNLMGHCAADRHNEAFHRVRDMEKMFGVHYDRIIWTDSDQYYPPDYYAKMLAHEESVVGSYSVSRYPPYEIAQYDSKGFREVDGVIFPDYQPVNQNEIKTDTFECDAVGLGAMMIDRNLIDIIEPVWFMDLVDSQGIRLLCDDFFFCWKLNQAGYRVLVDKNIMVGHYTIFLVLPTNRHLVKDARGIWQEYTGK